MKRFLRLPVVAVALAIMTLAMTGILYGGSQTNGLASARTIARRPLSHAELLARVQAVDPAFTENFDTGLVGCAIWDPAGNNTATVFAAELGDRAYWLNYFSEGVASRRVTFVVLPNFEGSPLSAQRQNFELPEGSEFDNISTAFGIPFWGLDLTSGPWMLLVRSNTGAQAMCAFTVEP